MTMKKLSFLSLLMMFFILNGFSQLDIVPNAGSSPRDFSIYQILPKKNKQKAQNKSVLPTEFIYDIADSIAAFSPNSALNGNAGIVYLNNEFWVSKWQTDSIFVFDNNGSAIDSFVVAGLSGTRSFTTDGISIFAGNATDTIYAINPTARVLDSTIVASGSVGTRVCAYDPTADNGNGGFWIANFTSDIELVDRSGNILTTITQATHGVPSMYGGFVDTSTTGGPYLAVYHQGVNRQAIIEFINIPSGTNSGIFYDTHFDLLSTQQPTATDDPIAGGLFLSDQYSPGTLTMMGVLQGANDILFGFEYETPTCVNPVGLSATTAANGTEIQWTSTATTSNIIYGPPGFTRGMGTKISNVTSPFVITSLPFNGNYEFRVEDSCGVANNSYWSMPASFTTPTILPLIEDFETFAPAINSNPWPNGWRSTATSNPQWESEDSEGSNENSLSTGPFFDNTNFGTSGGMYVYLETTGGSQGDNDTLISAPVYIDSSVDTVSLSFWYHMYGSSMGDLELYIQEAGAGNTLVTRISGEQQTAGSDAWLQFDTTLSGYTGKVVTLKFVGIRGSSYFSDMAIDDIRLEPVLPINAGVVELQSPTGVLCAGLITPVVGVKNFGSTTLDSVNVVWDVNGTLDSLTYIGQILPGDTASVSLATLNITAGQLYDLKFYTSQPNGQSDQFIVDDSLNLNGLRTGLSGNVTVDATQPASATNFQSFNSLLQELSNGICGNVTVDVAAGSGPYNEQVIFTNINGASSTSTLTINGNGETIEFAPSSSDKRIVGFDNASYINVKNLKIVGLDATYGFGIHFTNSSHHISIDSTEVDLSLATSTSSLNVGGIISSGSFTSMTTTGNNASDITITNSKVEGGTAGMYYGVRFNGNSTSDLDSLIRLENNEVANFYAYGVYLNHIQNSYIGNNDVHRADKESVTTFYGITTAGGSTNDTINANRIHNTHGAATSTTGTAYGIYNTSNDAESALPNLFVNNLLYDFNSSSGTVYAIYNLGSDNQAYVNNTISLDNIDATGGTTRGFYQTTTASGITFGNNNISITRGGSGTKHGVYFNTTASTITSDYNNIFVNSTGSGAQYVGRESATDQTTLLDWQTTPYGANSVSVDPMFFDAATGDFTPNEIALNGAGFNYGVPVDYFGIVRNNPPDIGAIEFEPPNLNAGVSQIVSPSAGICPGNIDIILEITNGGLLDLDSVNVYWEINGTLDSMTYVGLISSGTSENITLPTLNFTASQLYNITFYTAWPNGLADERPNDDTLVLNGLRTGLSGVYTLDPSQAPSSTNYTSFDSLTQDLNNFGVCGATTVDVAAGVYNEDIFLSNISGLSASNNLVINGVDSSQTIVSQDTEYGTLVFDNVQHVRVSNLMIEQTGSSGDAVIFTSGSRYDTLSNCYTRTGTSTTNYNISFSSSSTSHSNGVDADYNVIENNYMINGYYGIRIYGSTSKLNVYNRIINNEMDSIGLYGVYAYYQDSLEIISNKINMLSVGNTGADGIYSVNSYNPYVYGNYVWAADYGVYVSSGTGNYANPTRKSQFINNMIYSESDYGLYLYYLDSVDIWHNSIHVEGTTTPALQINASSSNMINNYDVRNNILSSLSTEVLETNVGDSIFIKLDNNVYYTNDTVLINIDGTTYPTLVAYQAARPLLNTASLEGDPQFLSNTDLHIIGSFVNDAGDNSVNVTEDIDGDPRPIPGATIVDIGADEFSPASCLPPFNMGAFNPGLDSVTIFWTGNISGVDFEYEIVTCGSAQGSGTSFITASDSFRIGGLSASSCYEFYVREICGRGDTSLWVGPTRFNTLNGVPYFQDFELWSNNTSGLISEEGWYTNGTATPHWEIGQSTSSTGTGPEEDHTIGTGGTFVYLECTGGSQGDNDTLYSAPVFVDSAYNAFEFEFWYHMHGQSMGDLKVFVSSMGILTPVVTISGEQQPAQTDAWLSFDTLLAGYAGQSIQLLFVGERGSNYYSDMAIDDVKLDVVPPVDGSIVGLDEPVDDSLQCYTVTENVSVELFNSGSDALDFTVDTAEISVNVSGAITQNLNVIVNDNTINGGIPLASGQSISVPVGSFDMTAIGTYYFDATVIISADSVQTNNTYSDSITTMVVSAGIIGSNDTICIGDTTTLSVSSYYGELQWQEFDGTSWVDIIGANEPTVDVDPISATDYRVLACGTDVSDTVEVYVTDIQFNVINNPTIVACDSTGTDTLIATTMMNGVEFTWYDSLVGGNVVHEGDTLLYTDSPSSSSTAASDTFYVSGSTGGSGGNVGPVDNTIGASANYTTMNHYLLFTVHAPTVIESVDVIANGAGLVDVEIQDSATQAVLFTHTVSVPAGGLQTLVLNQPLPPGDYRMGGTTVNNAGGLQRNSTGANYPYLSQDGSVEITGNTFSTAYYYFFYNWQLAGGCESPRQMVIGSVDCAVGLDDYSAIAGKIEVYPNPSNGLFTLNITTEQEEDFMLSVRDVQGKLIYKESLRVNGAHRDDIDLAGLAKGVYFLQIQNDQATKVEKLIIQ